MGLRFGEWRVGVPLGERGPDMQSLGFRDFRGFGIQNDSRAKV